MSPLEPAAMAAMYGSMRESVLQEECERALVLAGWLHYHTHDSRRSDPGLPDIIAVRGKRLIWRELKTQSGRLSVKQEEWRDKLLAAGADWALWRPFDWGDGSILRDIE